MKNNLKSMLKNRFLKPFGATAIVFLCANTAFAQAPTAGSDGPLVDILLYISYAATVFAALAAIILPFFKTTGDTKGLMQTGIITAVLLVIFAISYAVSGDEVNKIHQTFNISAGGSKLIGGVLIMTYIMTFGTIGLALAAWVRGLVS